MPSHAMVLAYMKKKTLGMYACVYLGMCSWKYLCVPVWGLAFESQDSLLGITSVSRILKIL